ncbi:O-antigen polymerase [Escherichia coli]
MIYLIIIFAICFSLFFLATRYMKSAITSPLILTLSSWMIMSAVGYLSYDQFDEFREESFYCLLIWIFITCFTYFVFEFSQKKKSIRYEARYSTRMCARYSIFVIPACVITAYEIYKVGTGGPVNFLLNLRLANIEENYDYPTFTFMPVFYPIIMSMFASICIYKSRMIEKVTICTWLLLFALGTMGKFAVITPIVIFLSIYEMKHGINKKKLAFFAPVLLAFILVMHFYRMADNDSASVAYVLGTYIYSPIVAFGTLVDSSANWAGDYTLRFMHAIAFKVGLSGAEPVKTILDYVYVPTPTNVYTVLQPFYSDMGYYGIAVGAIIYGVMISCIYCSAKSGNLLMLAFYSVLSVSMLTQFLSETILTNLSGNIKMLLCMFIIFRYFTRRIKTYAPQNIDANATTV